MAKKGKQHELYQLVFGQEAKPSPAGKREPETLTVSELTERIKSALKDKFPNTVHVVGEVSNCSVAGSGHVYFTLKDEQSQIGCILWRAKAANLKFKLTDGLAVVVHGSIDVYSPRGQYQLYVERVTLYGVGELELAFRQLKEKLQKQGLFDPAHKIPIPPFPLTLAVVTSPTGAAIRDILRTLELRWPVGRVLIYPVQVQGSQAAGQITEAIRDLNRQAERFALDTIILARGGGSLEDLWAFNEEIVAQAIYDSKLPVITGVGHEIDVTIADFVADHRAATPTAAAEIAAPVLRDVLENIDKSFNRLKKQVGQIVATENGRLKNLADRGMFKHPVVILGPFAQRFDELHRRLTDGLTKRADQSRRRTHEAELKLGKIAPNVLLAKAQNTLAKIRQKLKFTLTTRLAARKSDFANLFTLLKERSPRRRATREAQNVSNLDLALKNQTRNFLKTQSLTLRHLDARLAGLDYHQVLGRGFAIARRTKDSKIITSIAMISKSETIETQLADGRIESEVKKIGNRSE